MEENRQLTSQPSLESGDSVQDKLAHLQMLLEESLFSMFRRLRYFRRKLNALMSEEQIVQKKEECRAIFACAKLLANWHSSMKPSPPSSSDFGKSRTRTFVVSVDSVAEELIGKFVSILLYVRRMDKLDSEAVMLASVIKTLFKYAEFMESCPRDSPEAAEDLPSVSEEEAEIGITSVHNRLAEIVSGGGVVANNDRSPHTAEQRPQQNVAQSYQDWLKAADGTDKSPIRTQKYKGGSTYDPKHFDKKAIARTLAEFASEKKHEYNNYDFDCCTNDESTSVMDPVGFRAEVGSRSLSEPWRPLLIINTEVYTRNYTEHYWGRDHYNFLAKAPEGKTKEGPCAFSMLLERKGESENHYNLLVRTRTGEHMHNYVEVSKKEIPVSDFIAKFFRKRFPQYSHWDFHLLHQHQIDVSLKEFEQKQMETQAGVRKKFGVLYAVDGQGSNEDEMYNNVNPSRGFEEFLLLLGKKVELNGWTKYRGGLDVKGTNEATGTHSIYTDWRGLEIMFHVAPYLPYMEGVDQQIEKKRHIGNDIVVLVYHEGGSKFNPACIRSDFNHVWLVVTPDRSSNFDVPHYKVALVAKEEVKLFPPHFPRDYSFEHGDYFREFLLTKMMNGELATMQSYRFTRDMNNVRNGQLLSMVQDFL